MSKSDLKIQLQNKESEIEKLKKELEQLKGQKKNEIEKLKGQLLAEQSQNAKAAKIALGVSAKMLTAYQNQVD